MSNAQKEGEKRPQTIQAEWNDENEKKSMSLNNIIELKKIPIPIRRIEMNDRP